VARELNDNETLAKYTHFFAKYFSYANKKTHIRKLNPEELGLLDDKKGNKICDLLKGHGKNKMSEHSVVLDFTGVAQVLQGVAPFLTSFTAAASPVTAASLLTHIGSLIPPQIDTKTLNWAQEFCFVVKCAGTHVEVFYIKTTEHEIKGLLHSFKYKKWSIKLSNADLDDIKTAYLEALESGKKTKKKKHPPVVDSDGEIVVN